MSNLGGMTIGVDTGGTFTDFVFVEEDGRAHIYKALSTPSDPSKAILEGLEQNALSPDFRVVHGTTIATNALLERRGAKTALITTQGCRDVLEIARQTRDKLYDLCPEPRRPLIERRLRFEIPERLDCDGIVIAPLDRNPVNSVLDEIMSSGMESLAVCFLFSFLNTSHERAVGELARKRGLFVSLSSEVAPEFREYERTSTVCANAYVAPLMEKYLTGLQDKLAERGASHLSVMQSSGGTLRADEASKHAVKTVLSGPAGGVIAATAIGKEAGISRLITFDMGGTSTDVALIDGEPATVRTSEVAGLPLLTPMLDIHTVGAGGGSIARIDAGGGLKVGPQSAGADPGPAAYGKGNDLTVTDANVYLGLFPSQVKLAGTVSVHAGRVDRMMEQMARRAGIPVTELACGIFSVVNAQMARAIRHISIERGHDPAGYVLVSFGGAGGLHACALAEAVGINRVLVPRYPGAFSALGLAMADVRREYAQSVQVLSDSEFRNGVESILREMQARARAEMAQEGVANQVDQPYLEARYKGQSYALRLPYRRSYVAVCRDFHKAHKRRYGHSDPGHTVEVVTVGLAATGRSRRVLFKFDPHEGKGDRLDTCEVRSAKGTIRADVYRREDLGLDQTIEGAAIVIQGDATTWIPPNWRATVDASSNLILQRRSRLTFA